MNDKMLVKIKQDISNVNISEAVYEYIKNIIFSTRGNQKIKKYLESGLSPRAAIGIVKTAKVQAYLEGREVVLPEDVKKVVHSVLRHRIVLNYTAV
jgi:MoxR-like ATPase